MKDLARASIPINWEYPSYLKDSLRRLWFNGISILGYCYGHKEKKDELVMSMLKEQQELTRESKKKDYQNISKGLEEGELVFKANQEVGEKKLFYKVVKFFS